MTDRDRRYLDYLGSDAWVSQRESAFRKWGRFCNCCGSVEELTVHHMFYRNLTDCIDDDLMPLCRTCHDVFHAVSQPPYSINSERDHFEKRRLTLRRILRYRFNAFEKPIPPATMDRRAIWEAKKALRLRPEWRYVDYNNVDNQTMIAAANDPDFKVPQSWLIPEWKRGRPR